MRLLFDKNLSPRLVRYVAGSFPGSTHVRDVGLASARDEEVWRYASEQDFTIVSKDRDFTDLAFVRGAPPYVVWLRVGNASTDLIRSLLLGHADSIASFREATGLSSCVPGLMSERTPP